MTTIAEDFAALLQRGIETGAIRACRIGRETGWAIVVEIAGPKIGRVCGASQQLDVAMANVLWYFSEKCPIEHRVQL